MSYGVFSEQGDDAAVLREFLNLQNLLNNPVNFNCNLWLNHLDIHLRQQMIARLPSLVTKHAWLIPICLQDKLDDLWKFFICKINKTPHSHSQTPYFYQYIGERLFQQSQLMTDTQIKRATLELGVQFYNQNAAYNLHLLDQQCILTLDPQNDINEIANIINTMRLRCIVLLGGVSLPTNITALVNSVENAAMKWLLADTYLWQHHFSQDTQMLNYANRCIISGLQEAHTFDNRALLSNMHYDNWPMGVNSDNSAKFIHESQLVNFATTLFTQQLTRHYYCKAAGA